MTEPVDVLEAARRDLNLTIGDLWFRYFSLGGMSTALEIEAVLYGAMIAGPVDRDLLAVALNERFAEVGRDHPLAYTGDHQPDPS